MIPILKLKCMYVCRYYIKKRGRIINAPYVDLSYKWAGGGFLSTVGDLIKFGNVMLYSFQYNSSSDNIIENCNKRDLTKYDAKREPSNGNLSNNKTETNDETYTKEDTVSPSGDSSEKLTKSQESQTNNVMNKAIKPKLLPGYLRSETVKSMWNRDFDTKSDWDVDGFYGMGWSVVPDKQEYGYCRHQRYYTSHTGGAIGASSVLLIIPHKGTIDECHAPPRGVIVAMAVNMSSVGLNKTALEIGKLFEQVEIKQFSKIKDKNECSYRIF